MKKVLLCIMDGVGIRKNSLGNAYLNASTPLLDKLMNEYPNIKLNASGNYVGLPDGQMGNSEVGHMAIGSGRTIYQSLEKINKSILDKSFFENTELNNAIEHAKKNNSKLHLIGLLSDGGVHSHIKHLYALLELCKMRQFENVFIHVITDGRDTSPMSGVEYIKELEDKIRELQIGKIASVSGRYYLMDRDNNYDRIKIGYDMLVEGIGNISNDPIDVCLNSYDDKITDEFILPTLIDKSGTIDNNDSIITYNYRPDRLRELFTCLTNNFVETFERTILNNLKLVTFMPVDSNVICTNAYKPDKIENVLGQIISDNELSQLRIAETEKYAHVTYFFDGGKELDLKKCKRILIPSPKVATYDLLPKMSANEVVDNLIDELQNKPDLIVLNFANGDMVGHTGVYDAGVTAMEVVDSCIKRILDNINLEEYTVIITADHGNCEQMINDDGTINTAHTTNLVPLIILDKSIVFNHEIGKLPDIAPTILKIMNLAIPDDMDGDILINY